MTWTETLWSSLALTRQTLDTLQRMIVEYMFWNIKLYNIYL
jgi:hypothetical protein